MQKKLITIISILIFIFLIDIVHADATSSLSHAVGQMMMVGFNGTDIDEDSSIVKEIKAYHIGGILLDDHYNENGKQYTRNIQNPAQLKKLITKLQYYAKKYTHQPLFIAVNQEGGLINSLKASKGFVIANDQSQAALGKTNDLQLIFDVTYRRALLLKKLGINVDFAPVADLDINKENPAVGKLQRSFGDDPIKVSLALEAAIKAYKKAGILCTLKHFPGLGSAKANTDYASADVTNTWHPKELLPYEKLIKMNEACPFIMTSHLINRHLDASGVPASFSKAITTDLLIRKLHFSGLIITDDMDAQSITKNFPLKKAITKVVLAGNDIIIYDGTQGHGPDDDTQMLYKTLMNLAQTNPEIRQKIFAAYKKIEQIKSRIK